MTGRATHHTISQFLYVIRGIVNTSNFSLFTYILSVKPAKPEAVLHILTGSYF